LPTGRALVFNPVLEIPGREELEKRLGMCPLDGSFASLWTIERLLETVRRMPGWPRHMEWLKGYMADFFCSAFRSMEIQVTRTGNTIECQNIRYKFSTDADIPRIISPEVKQPMFYGLYWLGSPVLNKAALPYYAFATLAQNQEWAEADHDMIGRKRDHLNRIMPWLVEDTLQGIDLPPGLRPEDVRMLVSACVWPPLGFQMNEKAEYNLKKIAERVRHVSDQNAVMPFLRTLARSQNYFIRLVVAAYCVEQGIEPQNRDEALAYREAGAFFETGLSGALRATVARYLPDDEAPLIGRNDPLYERYGEAVARGDYAAGLEDLNKLVAASPTNAMFLCSRGDALTHLGRSAEALHDFDASLRLYSGYWQVRINRGVLHSRAKRYDLSDADLFEAAKIRYGDADARNNLLCNYFFRLDGQSG
jgi:tetratricopeptide (TPR) repeat protein